MEEIDFENLPKKERKRLKHQMERRELEGQKKKGAMIKWFVIGVIVIAFGIGGWFGIKELSKPLPGQEFESQGREHVPQEAWSKFNYNSNPPTSGPHDEVWTRAGIYDTPQGDGHLIHSLEHGYVIVSYNCGGVGDASGREIGYQALSDEGCNELKKNLSDLANDKKLWKLIVVPREKLEVRLAVAAWTRLDKMNEFNKDRITAFIDAHRDHGPEQAME